MAKDDSGLAARALAAAAQRPQDGSTMRLATDAVQRAGEQLRTAVRAGEPPFRPDHELTSAGGGFGRSGPNEVSYVHGEEPEGWIRQDLWDRAKLRGTGEASFAPEDPEVLAMAVCTEKLLGLDSEARERVLDYLSRRFR
jgi:hypothetical protein